MNRRRLLYGGIAAATAGFAAWRVLGGRPAGRSPGTTDTLGDQVQTRPKGELPDFAGSGEIQRLYRYAVEDGDELQYMPCFCGCYRFGHTSNRDCYIKAFNRDGTLTFTSHAAT